ncbi:MAG: potassium channel protein [Actinobacteria bacterium]|nr:MAG: potassium channel protein [Actinomycetota bacterium]
MGGRRTSRDRIAIESVFGPEGEAARRIRLAILMLSGIIFVGTAGYMAIGWNFLDALYMTVITVGTIGFEEVRNLDESVAGRLWTIVLIISGVAVLGYATTSLVALAVEGTVRDYLRSRRMRAEIGKLGEHQIICGYGRVGRQVAEEFAMDGVPFVVIDQDPSLIEERLGRGHPALLGEASDDETLEEAGVRRAKGLVAAVDSDADNVFVVLSARKLNAKLHIVARTSSDASAAKLEIAGADRTISPYAVGGHRLASLATQPVVVDFLDIVTRGEKGIEFRLEEFGVPKESPFADHTIGELKIGEKTGAIVLAIRTPEGTFNTTPSAQDVVHPGDTLIVLGTREQVTRLEALMTGVEPADDGPPRSS